ncbi:hypothetical protein HUU51_02910 [Candidatus Gracilibacteria bacterium]|nr:hypothetical protein [Candidatus Gracilibacteria bacterium]
MQKIQKNAYILLWSIFLSLIIGISFLSISSQIAKNLKENSELKEKIITNNNINNKIIEAIENNNFEKIELKGNEVIIFEKSNYYKTGLKENEEIYIKTTINGNVTIKINYGSPIYYINNNDITINGIINDKETFVSGIGEIYIKNLGGYSNIDIISENNFETKFKRYKIIKKIGNKDVIKENNLIKIF